ncbi:hypothetical protein VNO77_23770 [Canavalia gladiata]|uniref:Uncharacterized protein n=1 Tax=Canavalia gladiata TaxID=3824 RepID=A0AAN9Q992_CANGL
MVRKIEGNGGNAEVYMEEKRKDECMRRPVGFPNGPDRDRAVLQFMSVLMEDKRVSAFVYAMWLAVVSQCCSCAFPKLPIF